MQPLLHAVVAYLPSPLGVLPVKSEVDAPNRKLPAVSLFWRVQGVQPLLDAVVAYLPSPLDVPPVKGSEVDAPDQALTRRPDDGETFSALAFKIMADQFVGSLTFLRIYRRGTLSAAPSIPTPET